MRRVQPCEGGPGCANGNPKGKARTTVAANCAIRNGPFIPGKGKKGREPALQRFVDGISSQIKRCFEYEQNLSETTPVRCLSSRRTKFGFSIVRGRVNFRRHWCCLCAPGSNPGKRLGGRRAVQKALLLAGHNPSRSQVYPATEPNGSRNPPLDRFSLPYGKACSASGSNNRVPERTPDQQR